MDLTSFLPKEMMAMQAGQKIAGFLHTQIQSLGIEQEDFDKFCTVIGLYEKEVGGTKQLSPYYAVMNEGQLIRYADIGEIIDSFHSKIEEKIINFMVREAKEQHMDDLSQMGIYIYLALMDHPNDPDAYVAVPEFRIKRNGEELRRAELKEIV